MKRLMFDIETLSTFPDAAVIAIAVVIRDDENPSHLQARSWFIDLATTIGHRNPETMDWWAAQDPHVKNIVFAGNQVPREAIQELNGFLLSNGIHPDRTKDVRCYAAPASFDFPILTHQYQMLGLTPAWSWRTQRCLSSWKHELEDNLGIEIADVEPELRHHPVHDCLAQFKELDACFLELQRRRNQ